MATYAALRSQQRDVAQQIAALLSQPDVCLPFLRPGALRALQLTASTPWCPAVRLRSAWVS
jgi:hypothetical protein